MTEPVATVAPVMLLLSLLSMLVLLAIVAWQMFSARTKTGRFDAHGLPEPTRYPEMPPFRFVGMSEKGSVRLNYRDVGGAP